MEERSGEVSNQCRKAEQQYDYLILGISAALFAYIAKSFTPLPLGFNKTTFELSSIVAFFLSVVTGILILRYNKYVIRNNYELLNNLEVKGELSKVVKEGKTKLNILSGEYVTPDEAEKEIKRINDYNPIIERLINEHSSFSYILS